MNEAVMFDFGSFIKFTAALLAISDPIGNLPVFIALTAKVSESKARRIAVVAILTFSVTLGLAAIGGREILALFGVGLDSFRAAGGLIVLLMAVSMLGGRTSVFHLTEQEKSGAEGQESVAIVPLAIPLMAGPGAVATVILFAESGGGGTVAAGIATVAAAALASLWFAPAIAARIGKTGVHIATRIMGMILAAIGFEMIAAGLRGLFPGWG